MESWQAAEQEWRALVIRYGPPVQAVHLSADRIAEAIAEGRVLALDIHRDGYGGGGVRFDLARTNRAGGEYAHHWFCVVFPSPCRLTLATVQRLNANAWESWADVYWVTATAELVAALDEAADFARSREDPDACGTRGSLVELAARIGSLSERIPRERMALDELLPIFAPRGAWDRVVGASGKTLADHVTALRRQLKDAPGSDSSDPAVQPGQVPSLPAGHQQRHSGSVATRQLLNVLSAARALLALPGNDFTWSSWPSAEDALRELDGLIAAITAGSLPPRADVAVLFAPTGPIQEVSLSSGWAAEFLALAQQFDAALARAFA
jgi:hypothetical protein